jgi:GTPase
VTLDPLVRRVRLPDRRELLVSDTVGFIDRLPHTLVAAFRATLEEVVEADLVLHVIDAASPERERHMAAVRNVLAEMDAAEVPRLHVYNKCDLLGADELRRLQASDPSALFISARTGAGRDELLEAIAARLALDVQRVRLEFDPASVADRALVARLYRDARVLQHVQTDDRVMLEADVPRRLLERLGRARRMAETA